MQFIYKVSLSIDHWEARSEHEFNMRVTKFKCEEKDKTYKFFDGRWRKFKKDKLHEISTIFDTDSYKFIQYSIYTTEEMIESTKLKLIDRFNKEITKREKAAIALRELFNNGYTLTEKEEIE